MSTKKSEVTRRRLISAARAEFAEHGIAGARVDRIAAASGVNKQRIYPNFGNKEGLFSAVIADTYTDLAKEVPVPETVDEMHGYVAAVYDYHSRNDGLVRLLAWEGLHYGTRDFPGQSERQAYYLGKSEALSKALGLDSPQEAANLLFTLIAIASWPFVAQQQRRLMTELPGPQEGVDPLRDSLSRYGESLIESARADVMGRASAG